MLYERWSPWCHIFREIIMHKKKCLIELPLITTYEFLKYLMIQVQENVLFILYIVFNVKREIIL